MSKRTDKIERTCPLGKDIVNEALLAIQPIATVNATDATSAATLANANKAKINEILAALQG